MPALENQKYTPGFVFDSTLEKALLIHKQRPEWQKGKINGICGKYEPGESAAACIRRETREESKLDIPESDWIYVGEIVQEVGNVGVLAAKYSGNLSDAQKNDHEEIEWFNIKELPENVMGNLRWLIPLSLEKFKGEFKTFSVQN